MEVMLKAHKQHENAVLTLLTHLELAREEKALREEQLKKRLVVVASTPPPAFSANALRPRTEDTLHFAYVCSTDADALTALFQHLSLLPFCQQPFLASSHEAENLEGDKELIEKFNIPITVVCRCYFFSTFFYAKLSGASGSEEAAYNYEGVRGRESIRFFDSLNGKHKPLAERLRRYLRDEHEDKKGLPLDKERTWYAKANGEPEEGAPQQENGFDCGVFLCQMAECIADGRAFDFQQKDIKNIRLKMPIGSESELLQETAEG
ncbi:ulp1 protease c-terminal catalytic domain-containing protein [Cyclospora cayetanensis]|uniref:Ulp1 protease c-terminal catalytic domain-containing protein n=1 Tax=Cyclospora cayetanensis TaxID=88456 RepID=A0A1D3D0N3_9EIME|nr:ulp1 protease c-terminal catalytic domain-containing protein [Cyclospora cayetanensis]